MAKKINYFTADRNMSDRVAEYFRCKLQAQSIRKHYADSIKTVRAAIESAEKLAGSILADTAKADIEKYETEIARLESERDNQLKAEARFEYTKADRAFKATVKGHAKDDTVKCAVEDWLSTYGVQGADTENVARIMDAIGSAKFSADRVIESDGRRVLVVNPTEALNALYGTLFEDMVDAGTIKPAQVPENLRADYEARLAKKNAKKAKKSEKKVEKVAA